MASRSPIYTSQAARQGLAVLMASSVVVLKQVTSTLRQRHNSISIDLTFGVSDNVREVTSPDEVGSGPMSGRDATWGNTWVLWLFFVSFQFFLFLYSSTQLQPIPENQFSRKIAQKMRSGVRKTRFGMRNVSFWNLGVFYPKNTLTIGRKGQLSAKIKCRITP